MNHGKRSAVALLALAAGLALAQPPETRVDVLKMQRPIAMRDTVWIEDMTLLEIRDSLQAGKTTALVLVGGMEDNGPYVTVSQHNSVVRFLGEKIARELGNALCAPVVTMAPGNPETSTSPGSIVLSSDTYRNMLEDMGTSLKAEGFQNILFLVDHGGDQKGAVEAAKDLSGKWQGSGVRALYVPAYYDYDDVEKYQHDVLGVHEKSRDGYHDDYYTSVISLVIDPNGVRMKERRQVHKTTINGLDLASPRAVEDGRKIIAYRTGVTVKAIREMLAGN
ncbi:MAG TPA: creatininase family protein [Bryobacteraceae bacterium]|nr:creatininase family protein [Bryobacteraceae bacterium]